MSLFPVSKVQDAAVSKATDMMANNIEKGARERDELLSVYDESIKVKISKIVNQHKIAGALAGRLPTHGILTTLNLIILYNRLGSAVDIKTMQELDSLLSKAISASKKSFFKLGASLFVLKQVVSVLDESIIGAPLGLAVGLFCGYKFTHWAGLSFAKNISDMVDEAVLKHDMKQRSIT